MQKMYKIVLATLLVALLFVQNNLQAQKCCVECQADVKAISDKQVLLEKIDIKEGTLATNVNTNVYVSYSSGNSQKFWANIAIATAGIAVSTQLNSSPITAGDSKTQSAISPIVPLGVSVATLPSIWKNRPRGVPQAGLFVQHRDLRGKLLDTWEQPISSEAKNSAELLTIAIDKPLSAGTLEVYLQNGSKNEVYYWGVQTLKNEVVDDKQIAKIALPKPNKPVINEKDGCPDGQAPDGFGNCVVEVDSGELNGVTVTGSGNNGVGNSGISTGALSGPWSGGSDPNSTGMGGQNGNGAYDNSGGGGNSGGGEQDRLNRCSSVYNVWALSVEAIKQIHKNSYIGCAAGIGIVDAVAAATTYENGGKFSKGPWTALVWSLSLFNKLDEMYNCMREADEKKGIDLDILWNNYQAERRANNCN
jgi:hypothetical protein